MSWAGPRARAHVRSALRAAATRPRISSSPNDGEAPISPGPHGKLCSRERLSKPSSPAATTSGPRRLRVAIGASGARYGAPRSAQALAGGKGGAHSRDSNVLGDELAEAGDSVFDVLLRRAAELLVRPADD